MSGADQGHHGKIWWTELNTWDAEGAKAFYAGTFGWTFEEGPIVPEGFAPYWVAKRGGETVGGLFTLRSPEFDGMPSFWFTYLAVDDIQEGLAAAVAAGGTVKRDTFRIPGVGAIAIVADSAGAMFGMIEPESPPA